MYPHLYAGRLEACHGFRLGIILNAILSRCIVTFSYDENSDSAATALSVLGNQVSSGFRRKKRAIPNCHLPNGLLKKATIRASK